MRHAQVCPTRGQHSDDFEASLLLNVGRCATITDYLTFHKMHLPRTPPYALSFQLTRYPAFQGGRDARAGAGAARDVHPAFRSFRFLELPTKADTGN